jgi:hypothetical protein
MRFDSMIVCRVVYEGDGEKGIPGIVVYVDRVDTCMYIRREKGALALPHEVRMAICEPLTINDPFYLGDPIYPSLANSLWVNPRSKDILNIFFGTITFCLPCPPFPAAPAPEEPAAIIPA